jgi:CheY-like chemotaxis protein
MTGYEVATAISNDTGLRGMRLIALTGYDQPTDQARAAGFERHITKPVDLQTIRDTIGSLR